MEEERRELLKQEQLRLEQEKQEKILEQQRQEEAKAETSCCCGGSKSASEVTSTCCGEKVNGICCIKVLGSGCKACHQLYDNTLKAVEGMGIEVEYVTDLQKIMEYGAMSMPALVINEMA